jgi:predicted component of type VI protein secretion system
VTGSATSTPSPATGSAEPSTGNSDEPPTGTAAQIMEWVNGDPHRAQLALNRELQSESPRTSLIADLERKGAIRP